MKNDETWKLPLSVSLIVWLHNGNGKCFVAKWLQHIYSLSAVEIFSIAAGHKDNKPIIFAMKHVPLLSTTTNLYATTPYNLDA